MKRLVGNALGLVIFLLLVQWAIQIIPGIAATAQSVFMQLIPSSVDYYQPAPLTWPTQSPEDPRPSGGTQEEPPVEEPTPEPTLPTVPTPVVTPDPVVEPTPEPEPTITWICPIEGVGGC